MTDSYNPEEALARLNAVIETVIDGIITIDEKGIIDTINPAAAELFGYEKKEVIGKNINMLMPQPHRRQHDGYLNNYMTTGVAKIIGIGREVPGLKKDGTVFPFRLAVSEVNFKNDIRIFTGIIHDLTAEKEAVENLKKYSMQLETEVVRRTNELSNANKKMATALEQEKQLNDLKSRFVSMASHEFRTPLSTIMSSATLISRYENEVYLDKRNKHINRIKSAVHNLTNILNDFLSLEKLERGKMNMVRTQFNFRHLMEEVIDEMKDSAKVGQKFHVTCTGDREEVLLDENLMKNVLHNLLSNAIKYSPENSSIEVDSHCTTDALKLIITDHGIGIPEEEQKHLFQRFFRAHNVTNIQGTGLGLSIVKEYVELMGGEISFTSKSYDGTSITLKFPFT